LAIFLEIKTEKLDVKKGGRQQRRNFYCPRTRQKARHSEIGQTRAKVGKGREISKGNSFFFDRVMRDGWMERDKAYKV
jgi:hypothetical protein